MIGEWFQNVKLVAFSCTLSVDFVTGNMTFDYSNNLTEKSFGCVIRKIKVIGNLYVLVVILIQNQNTILHALNYLTAD